MGEIADDMINGSSCSLCGQYFNDPNVENDDGLGTVYEHGYPVYCKECWEDDCGYPKADVDTF